MQTNYDPRDELDGDGNEVTIACFEIGGTDKAMLISMNPKDPTSKGIWLPKSQISHISRHPDVVNGWRQIEITIPEWLAEKKGL